MKMDDIRHGFSSLKGSVAEGWNRLRESASGTLTHFKPEASSNLPAQREIDDRGWLATHVWALVGGDVFEDEQRIVVRLEVPGMDRKDFHVEVLGDALVVRGEKRFERESTEGRWRTLQCAYGSFHRSVPLPVPVKSEEARATYKDGVLKVELPKAVPAKPRTVEIRAG